jgi:hypothetical protein
MQKKWASQPEMRSQSTELVLYLALITWQYVAKAELKKILATRDPTFVLSELQDHL